MTTKDKIWSKDFILISLSSFFMFLTFYISVTSFPLYIRDTLHGNAQQMGLVVTFYVIGSVLARPFTGQWVDRWGKEKLALIGTGIFLITCISYFSANAIIAFLLLRFIHGTSYATISTSTNSIAASLVPASRQGEGMGYFSMFMSIAMVIGPALGLYIWKDGNVQYLFTTISVIAGLSLVCLIFSMQRAPVPARKAKEVQSSDAKTALRWHNIFERKAVPVSIVGFMLAFSYGPIAGFIAPFTSEIREPTVSGIFFIIFATMIVLFRPFVGKLFDNYNEHILFYPGMIFFALGLFVLSQAHTGAWVMIASVFSGIGYGALFPCLQATILKLSPSNRIGVANGTFFLLFDLGYGVGTYVMGIVASLSNYSVMYMSAAGIAIVSLILYYVLHHRQVHY
ncbi:MFS transporter [Paenibacillus sp. S02]|uniref:MFS transporter n=1 Tax=Paenibacillus sp. S02 TaxID=2823904 RepID=UPI001C650460|nr:MFS transporter [Paenibacillus sp. S02]QYK67544.1 putative MFS-type transporter YhhS [Paenibacillus sp. S02]